MFIKAEFIRNKQLKRILEHAIYLTILLLLIPGLFYFELCIVLPAVVEEWSVPYIFHVFCATYLLLNIIGNLIYGACTDTSIKGKLLLVNGIDNPDWTICTVCECLRPPRAWHCDFCNICILKRDHHCTFLACCVGYFNHRYFMLFTFYVFVAMLYAFYFNVIFLAQFITWNHGLVIIKFIFPLASFAIDFSHESFYVFLVVINVFIILFTGFLFFYHFNNILKGITTPEKKQTTNRFLYNKYWKSNLVEVFGRRWYLTWILPFFHSPLPGNGMEWPDEDKYKSK